MATMIITVRPTLLTTARYINYLNHRTLLQFCYPKLNSPFKPPQRLTNLRNAHSFINETEVKQTSNEPKSLDNASSGLDDDILDALLFNQQKTRTRSKILGSALDRLSSIETTSSSNLLTDKSSESMPSMIKRDIYEPSEVTVNRTQEEILAFRNKFNVEISSEAPPPIFTFDELQNLPQNIADDLKKNNISECTPIQAQGLPIVLSGTNLIGKAPTGCGKTLAYIIPALLHIINQPRIEHTGCPVVLLLVPTRELAKQIYTIAERLGSPLGIKSTLLYGGTKDITQLTDLEERCDLVVATAGRLIDLMNTSDVSLKYCSYLVLDEVDKLLDMGFEKQTRRIVSNVPADAQMLLWAATISNERIMQPAHDLMGRRTYSRLDIGQQLSANANIHQKVIVCDVYEKQQIFVRILDEILKNSEQNKKTVIFARTAKQALRIASYLKKREIRADVIYGKRVQHERDQVFSAFNNNELDMLVGTIVAGRGLDVKNIKNVILYDFPETCADYINQIGRTGRAGENGIAYVLFDRFEDKSNAKELISILKATEQDFDDHLVEVSERFSASNQKIKKKKFENIRVAAST